MDASKPKTVKIETRKPFEESMHGLLYDLFRRAGLNIPVGSIDLFRGTVKKLAILIVTETKLLVLKEVQALQDRIRSAVKSLGEIVDTNSTKIEDLEKRVEALEARLVDQNTPGAGPYIDQTGDKNE